MLIVLKILLLVAASVVIGLAIVLFILWFTKDDEDGDEE